MEGHELLVAVAYAARIARAAHDAQELVELLLEMAADDRVGDEKPLRQMVADRLAVLEECGATVPLPSGLRVCPRCGGVAGTSRRTGLVSACACDGIACRWCGIGRVKAPLTDSYDPADRAVWHVPAIAGRHVCGPCEAAEQAIPDVAISASCVTDSPLRDELARIRAVGQTLMRSVPFDVVRGANLIALHGDDAAWQRLVGYGLPRDEPPLYVGASIEVAVEQAASRLSIQPGEAEQWMRESLTAGCCGIDDWYLEDVIDALRARWHPPLH